MKATMERAVVDAYFYMQERFFKAQEKNLFWPDRHWSYYFLTDPEGGFSWETATALFFDNRSDMYHPGTYYPKKLAKQPATVYLAALWDSDGIPLSAGKAYKIHVPKDVPAKQFWALTVYDYATWAGRLTGKKRLSPSNGCPRNWSIMENFDRSIECLDRSDRPNDGSKIFHSLIYFSIPRC